MAPAVLAAVLVCLARSRDWSVVLWALSLSALCSREGSARCRSYRMSAAGMPRA